MKRKYTDEQIEFLRDHPGSYKQKREDFAKKYGRVLSEAALDHLADRYNFRHGHRYYKHQRRDYSQKFKGRSLEANKKPLLYERRNNNGSISIKVRNGERAKNFIAKSRYVWQKHYGKIDKNDIIIYLDGDNGNCDINNLYKVDRKTLVTLNKMNLIMSSRELMDTAVKIVKISSKIAEKRREKKCK